MWLGAVVGFFAGAGIGVGIVGIVWAAAAVAVRDLVGGE
jgi:hypothetical protein